MDIGREQILEIVVSVTAVGLMFGVLYWIGSNYSANRELSATGGELLVYSVVFFIVAMSLAGVILAYTVSEGGDDGDNATAN